MQEQSNTKICPMCAETIQAAAKICPHCRSWQKFWSWRNHHVLSIFAVFILTATTVGMGLFFEKLLGRKERLGDHSKDITILHSEFIHRVAGSNVMVTVVGMVTNHGSIAWKDVAVEAQLIDASGKLIDVIQADELRGILLLPHGEAAFRIEGKAARPQADYSGHKTFIRFAKDADAWP